MTHDRLLDSMGIPGLLRAARGSYGHVVRAAFAEAGFDDIPRNGAYVLARTHDGSAPLADLTRELGISKQAVSQLIDIMVMRGYMQRTVDPEDRRRMLVTLTPRGEEAARVSWEAANSVDAELASRLTPEGVAALRAGLIALAEMAVQASPAGP
jgi:DNA-binding MarR family transcriptional regulator